MKWNKIEKHYLKMNKKLEKWIVQIQIHYFKHNFFCNHLCNGGTLRASLKIVICKIYLKTLWKMVDFIFNVKSFSLSYLNTIIWIYKRKYFFKWYFYRHLHSDCLLCCWNIYSQNILLKKVFPFTDNTRIYTYCTFCIYWRISKDNIYCLLV